MEVIVYLLAIGLVVYLLYLLVVYVILPIASVLGIITLVVSTGYALVVSLLSFGKSFKNNLDPYAIYVDNHPEAASGVKRNYCFGPGFHQISAIVTGAFENLGEYRTKLTAWKDKALRHKWFVDMWIYIGYGFAIFCAQVLGFIWVAAFSMVLATAIVIGMICFFLFFSVLWLTDRGVLLIKSIHSRCPNCKRKSVIPVFICPSCGLEHKKLVPGPYGVMKRKCTCGAMLSTTFLGGRSEYEAHCPFCATELLSSSSQQYGIQLVGGVGTGKTTFLAAFWHEYKGWLSRQHSISFEETPVEAFADLEEWFHTGKSESTLETNANMYSIIHATGQNTTIQMTIYDIAGEAFDFAGSETQQQQFRYCEGFLVVIDPTATPSYVSDTLTNFINSLEELKGKRTAKADSVPVAVIITKSDLYKKEIGIPRIRASYKPNSASEYQTPFEQHQNDICRSFLFDHGYGNAVNLIEAEFSNIRYFPVSAMGHSSEEGQYEPWGVKDPVFWLMDSDNCPLRSIIQQQ